MAAKKKSLKRFVFVNGYGLVPFRIVDVIDNNLNEKKQYRGEIKLPLGVKTYDGKKWMEKDYTFLEKEVFDSVKAAIKSITIK